MGGATSTRRRVKIAGPSVAWKNRCRTLGQFLPDGCKVSNGTWIDQELKYARVFAGTVYGMIPIVYCIILLTLTNTKLTCAKV